ncbi:hypothetical protein FJZ26_03945 [Candidatus Parvarchaeota archaeon]|nr:hypothetical protein [Candidatus Parvarchaeota archaeon]
MGLDELEDEILKKARHEAKEMAEDAQSEASKLLDEARARAKAQVEHEERSAVDGAAEQSAERTAAARLEAKKIVSDGSEAAISASMDQVWECLCETKKSKAYPQILKSLATKGIRELSGYGNLAVKAQPQDRKNLSGLKAEVSQGGFEGSGGVVVETKDGRVRADYSFESIFAASKDSIRRDVHNELFGRGRK